MLEVVLKAQKPGLENLETKSKPTASSAGSAHLFHKKHTSILVEGRYGKPSHQCAEEGVEEHGQDLPSKLDLGIEGQ